MTSPGPFSPSWIHHFLRSEWPTPDLGILGEGRGENTKQHCIANSTSNHVLPRHTLSPMMRLHTLFLHFLLPLLPFDICEPTAIRSSPPETLSCPASSCHSSVRTR